MCRDECEHRAWEAQVDAEWLAKRVLAGDVTSETSVEEIKELWKEKQA